MIQATASYAVKLLIGIVNYDMRQWKREKIDCLKTRDLRR
jgi:hypothetical protein